MKFAYTLPILAFLVLSGPALAEDDENLRHGCDSQCCRQPDGTKCNMGDGNKCLKNSKCFKGRCQRGPEKVCHAPTQCKNTSPCDPDTGFCTYTLKPNWTPCDDGQDSTTRDFCYEGFCYGSK